MLIRATLAIIAALVLAVSSTRYARAQGYPTRPITVVVTSGPGGMDTLVRMIEPLVSRRLGQPLIIENKPGANGVIGVQQVVRSAPDGYTVVFATISTLAINPFVYKDLPYDVLRDLEPVARHATLPMVWAANPSRPFKTLDEAVAFARANPGKLTVGNPGNGSYGHLLEEAFKKKNGIEAVLVPFKSAPAAINDTVGGFVDICVDNVSNLSGLLSGGQLVALGVTSKERVKSLPQAPSWLENGTGSFEANAWYAFMAPKATPKEVVDRLNAAINEALASPEVQERLASLDAQFTPFTPDGLRQFIASELDLYGRLAREAGLTPQ